MLCHFCENLVFVPMKEVSVQNPDWSTDSWFIYDPDTWLVSVHQPSREALELSAGQGCRVCAMFWFRLFYDAGASHARHGRDREAAPILLSTGQLSWGKDSEMPYPTWQDMKLRCGERRSELKIDKPISGMIYGHV